MRVVLVGQTNGSVKSKEFLFLAAGVSMLFHRALAMFWWAIRDGWKQSNCVCVWMEVLGVRLQRLSGCEVLTVDRKSTVKFSAVA